MGVRADLSRFDELAEHFKRLFPQFGGVGAVGGEAGRHQRREFDPVDPHKREILGHAVSHALRLVHRADGDEVVDAEHRRRIRICLHECAEERAPALQPGKAGAVGEDAARR